MSESIQLIATELTVVAPEVDDETRERVEQFLAARQEKIERQFSLMICPPQYPPWRESVWPRKRRPTGMILGPVMT